MRMTHKLYWSQNVGGISACGGRRGGMSSAAVRLAAGSARTGARSQRTAVKIRRPKSEGRNKAEVRRPNKNFVRPLRLPAATARDSRVPPPHRLSAFALRISAFLPPSGFASSFLNCTQNGFNILLHATSSWISFRHTLVRQDRTFISTCASRNIGTAAREGPVFREIVTSADGEALSHFGSGSASLGFLSRRHPRQPLQPISWFRFGLRDGSQLRQSVCLREEHPSF